MARQDTKMSCKNSSHDSIKLSDETKQIINKIAELILNCDAILFTSGAGMGVSSGLSTFRGIAAGVWPPLLEHPKLDYTDICNPSWFQKTQGNSISHDTANFGYAFWSHQYNIFSSAVPHDGYLIAKRWSQLNHIKFAFSYTSNVDEHWRKSGWDDLSIFECHGSIDYMQCVNNCCDSVWPTNDSLKLKIDSATNCVVDSLPLCRHCNQLARPNILMFDDWHYAGERYNEQIDRYEQFKLDLLETESKLLVIELGAGTTVPSVRIESEKMFNDKRWIAHFVRINPATEHSVIDECYKNKSRKQTFELCMDALTALTSIDQAVDNKLKK
jgi:NAD-dependent SIR2 family protein deacetylase